MMTKVYLAGLTLTLAANLPAVEAVLAFFGGP